MESVSGDKGKGRAARDEGRTSKGVMFQKKDENEPRWNVRVANERGKKWEK